MQLYYIKSTIGLKAILYLLLMSMGCMLLPSSNATQLQPDPVDLGTDLKLIMFEEDGCNWCEKWNEEIGGIYPITAEGKKAPLLRINIHNRDYPPYDKLEGLYFTPTFVVMNGTQEVGRIRGYPGEHFFWPLLNEILDKQKIITPSE